MVNQIGLPVLSLLIIMKYSKIISLVFFLSVLTNAYLNSENKEENGVVYYLKIPSPNENYTYDEVVSKHNDTNFSDCKILGLFKENLCKNKSYKSINKGYVGLKSFNCRVTVFLGKLKLQLNNDVHLVYQDMILAKWPLKRYYKPENHLSSNKNRTFAYVKHYSVFA